MNGSNQLILLNIENTDAVGGFVGRRQFALIDARASQWGTAQSDVEKLVIRAGMNAARPFAERYRGEHLQSGTVNFAEIAGSFVGHIDAEVR